MSTWFGCLCYFFLELEAFLFFKDFLLIFGERGKGREINSDVIEQYQSAGFCTHPTGDQAQNPNMYPDQEMNR